jgi:hypothetical protein
VQERKESILEVREQLKIMKRNKLGRGKNQNDQQSIYIYMHCKSEFRFAKSHMGNRVGGRKRMYVETESEASF